MIADLRLLIERPSGIIEFSQILTAKTLEKIE
jgi:hypothetical protein